MVIIEFLFTPHPENVDVRSRENTTRRFGNVYLSKSVGDTTSLELGVYAQTVIKGFDEKRPGTLSSAVWILTNCFMLTNVKRSECVYRVYVCRYVVYMRGDE